MKPLVIGQSNLGDAFCPPDGIPSVLGHVVVYSGGIIRQICHSELPHQETGGGDGMNYENFTDTGLRMMHDAVHKAIAADSVAMKRGEPPPCRTSDTKDWRDHAGGLEEEMARRNVPFIPVRFLDRSGR